MCDSNTHPSCLSPLEKNINDKKLAIDLLKISDNTYVGFRDQELSVLDKFINGCIENKSGGSMFIFGLSGTGKTTTVEHALSKCAKEFKNVKTVIMRGSTYISLKAFKHEFFHKVLGFTNKMASKTLDISSNGRVQNYSKFANLLIQHFKSIRDIRVCLIDEIDYLSTFFSNLKGYDKSNWLVQALFKAACSSGSKVVILAISNNLEFASKIKAESCEKLMFKPYNENQMVSIVMEKLKSLNNEDCQVLNKTTLLLLARRVANTTGDCRTYLDSFVRALSNSLTNLERDSEYLSSMETTTGSESTDKVSVSEQNSIDKYKPDTNKNQINSFCINNTNVNDLKEEELRTPTRDLGQIDLNKYNVGNKEIGVVTPTLSLNKREQLKLQIYGLPTFQLLLLLAVCKSGIILDEIISPNEVKKFYLELAEKLKLDSGEAENFCNSEFENSLDNFRQLGLISKEEMTFKTDPVNLAKIVLDSNCAFMDLDFDSDINDPNLMLTKRYSDLSKTFSFVSNCKKQKKRLWWCK